MVKLSVLIESTNHILSTRYLFVLRLPIVKEPQSVIMVVIRQTLIIVMAGTRRGGLSINVAEIPPLIRDAYSKFHSLLLRISL